VKPLVEGAQFYVLNATSNSFELQQFYLDFSLAKICVESVGKHQQKLLVEQIVKPELPKSTLELIRQKKTEDTEGFYEFNLVLQQHTQLKLVAQDYTVLK